MTDFFLKIVNMSIATSWLVFSVLILRIALKKAPKWVSVLLWGIVAVRLLCPFSIESALSLIPSAEVIDPEFVKGDSPFVQNGTSVISSAVNPASNHSFTSVPSVSANPLQIWIPVLAGIWVIGIAVLLIYTFIGYWRLRRKVDTAVILRDNIFQSENVSSPFVLGIMNPKIYVPFRLEKEIIEHVVAHEQAHIRRRDHWWKPLGFLLLTIHWFNPLMWLAYVLLCRDIELACDERVIKELGGEQRADYTQALLACSVSRCMIVACPLAFGEVGVKERVKAVMNYKRPTFWIIVLAIVVSIAVAVCFLTNPASDRKFSMKGHNVSDLDPQRIVTEIAKIEKLDDSSVLYTNADNFDLLLTSDFDWANSGTVRFFYTEGQQTYSAQLRLFIEEDRYFVTERTAWVEQERVFKIQSYLEALKFLPQEQIRQMAPDADEYSVVLVDYGTPGDFERVLTYTSGGVSNRDEWVIHLLLQPLQEGEEGYSGTGDEVIHLFYDNEIMDSPVSETVDKRNIENSDGQSNTIPYTVRISRMDVPIFDGPGYDYTYVNTIQATGAYTIVEEKLDDEGILWGKLKSGAGWIDIAEAKSKDTNHKLITVGFADEQLLHSGDYLEFIADESEYTVKLVFRSGEALKNVRFASLQHEEGTYSIMEELHTLSELSPDRPLVTGVVFFGDMTAYGISFTDADGNEQHFAVYISSRNGALMLEEYVP